MQKLFFLFSLLFVLGCADQKEEIPSYIKLEGWNVNAPGGVANQKLPHAFVYAGNRLLGGFPVPGLIPVLAEGDTEIEVYPGINENGSLQTPSIYSLMRPYKNKINLVRGQETKLTPEVNYTPDLVIAADADENFDGGNVLPVDDKDTDPATTWTLGTVGGFDGRYATMNIDTAHAINWIQFRQPMEGLPITGGVPVFLELHYQNDTPFEVFLFGTDLTGTRTEVIPVFEFNKSADWNKIYINLTDFLSSTRYAQYHLQFRAVLPRDLQTGKYVQDRGTIRLDNLRVLYF